MQTHRVEFTEEWGRELERKLEEYLADLEHGVDNPDERIETLTGEPYCGCQTCIDRETRYAITLWVLEGAQAGDVKLVDV